MSKVRNIEWNETQLNIALELSKDKTAHEIIAEGQFAETLVYNVAKAIKGGDEPPSLDEAYIASAPAAMPFSTGKKKENKPRQQASSTMASGWAG